MRKHNTELQICLKISHFHFSFVCVCVCVLEGVIQSKKTPYSKCVLHCHIHVRLLWWHSNSNVIGVR